MLYCKECGNELQSGSKFCAYCGAAVEEETSAAAPNVTAYNQQIYNKIYHRALITSKIKLIGGVLVAIVLVLAAIRLILPAIRIFDPYSDMRRCYSIAQEVICDKEIDTPLSAKFPSFKREFVTQRSAETEYDGHKYRVYIVSSYVDYDNGYGTLVRSKYRIKIRLCVDRGYTDEYFYDVEYFYPRF